MQIQGRDERLAEVRREQGGDAATLNMLLKDHDETVRNVLFAMKQLEKAVEDDEAERCQLELKLDCYRTLVSECNIRSQTMHEPAESESQPQIAPEVSTSWLPTTAQAEYEPEPTDQELMCVQPDEEMPTEEGEQTNTEAEEPSEDTGEEPSVTDENVTEYSMEAQSCHEEHSILTTDDGEPVMQIKESLIQVVKPAKPSKKLRKQGLISRLCKKFSRQHVADT